MSHSYGFIPGPLNPYAPRLSLPRLAAPFPSKFTLPGTFPSLQQQLDWGACVAHGTTWAMRYDIIEQLAADLLLSRMFNWWEGRKVLGTQSVNSGMMIHDAVHSASVTGIPPESDWPYVDADAYTQPSPQAYQDAPSEEAFITEQLDVSAQGQDLVDACKLALSSGVVPILGFTVYESFEADPALKSGTAPIPKAGEQILGGHCIDLAGWDDARGFRCANWWGSDWSENGFFWMPYAYFTTLQIVSDVWRISRVASVQSSTNS